ncbi:unnamed protein product, partial [Brassica oleracea]
VERHKSFPGKSVARFRCVSKHWAFLLRRSDFTELFLTKSLTRPRFLFTVKANGKLLFYSSPRPHNPDDNSSLVASPYNTSFPEYFPSDICSTVCGLVLLQGWKRKVPVICNPATGEFLTLPKSNPTEMGGMYFGYDPLGKQFKVLCMTWSRDERPNTHQALTLESGKRLWRTLEHKFHFVNIGEINGDICIDGVLYFRKYYKIVVCFDVRSEKFSFINTNEDMWYSLSLFNYKGKLGARCLVEQELELWVLEDAGNHKWSKRSFVFSPRHYRMGRQKLLLGITSKGEIVYSWNSFLLFYNLESNTVKRVNIQGMEGLGHPRICHTFVNYVENMKFI